MSGGPALLYPSDSQVWVPAPGTQVRVVCVATGPRALGSPVSIHLAWDVPGGQWRLELPMAGARSFFVPWARSDTIVVQRSDGESSVPDEPEATS